MSGKVLFSESIAHWANQVGDQFQIGRCPTLGYQNTAVAQWTTDTLTLFDQ